MSVPVGWQEQATQVRMVGESHSKQIVNFALEPVRSRPNTSDAFNAAARPHFQTHTLVGVDRKQVVDHLKRRFATIGVVHTRQIREIVKTQLAIALEIITKRTDLIAIDVDRELTNELRRVANRFAKLSFQFFDERMIAGVGRLWSFFLFL